MLASKWTTRAATSGRPINPRRLIASRDAPPKLIIEAGLARLSNISNQVYQAHIDQRAVEPAFPFGGRRKVGLPAILKQAGAGREYRIEREACALQCHSSKKGDVEIGASSDPNCSGGMFKASIA